ncbi:MAG: SUMF1/EgtB/PvdO family nonheme iron enzyme [Myxococcota bacterium]
MGLDDEDRAVLYDALREGRRDPELLAAFDLAWADDLGLDEHGLWASVEGVHLRRIPKRPQGFWLGTTPVTQRQWAQFTNGAAPSHFEGPQRPVERVSFEECEAFLNRLPPGLAWRLPTEAEWEYACRAGTQGIHYGPLDEVAWHGHNTSGGTQPVGGKRPNALGLYDMSFAGRLANHSRAGKRNVAKCLLPERPGCLRRFPTGRRIADPSLTGAGFRSF